MAKAVETVDALLDRIDHPQRVEIDAVRKAMLSADTSISEGVKWNAPSFRTAEWFATVNLRSKEGMQVILHFGAKARAGHKRPAIEDPNRLLRWLGDDRAMATLSDNADDRKALAAIVRQWIAFV